MKMLALTQNSGWFIEEVRDTRDFLIRYAERIGLDKKVFTILANSNEMTINELVKYINNCCDLCGEQIREIFKLCDKVY